jgi:hypothetical protein
VPISFVFGMLVYTFVRPCYEDPAFALCLRVPAAPVILALQVGRGLLVVALVMPLAVLLRGRGGGAGCGPGWSSRRRWAGSRCSPTPPGPSGSACRTRWR